MNFSNSEFRIRIFDYFDLAHKYFRRKHVIEVHKYYGCTSIAKR